ncbi:MAG: GLPGLI family protein [Candidatus Saccharimonadaceae bacterium]
MKKKLLFKSLFTGIILACPFLMSSQIANDTINIGGLKTKVEEQVILEKANLGVYYQFTQKATENDKPVILKDTLLLVIGNSQSLFLDPYYKTNLLKAAKERRTRSMKTRLVNTEHEYLDEVLELVDASSDYKEESLGEPVQIYKNREEGVVSSVYNAFVENFITEQKTDEINNWEIVNETDTVFNYPCQKAITTYAGRTYTAWFTMDIPINDGPWKFCNLPGLILKVADDEIIFQYIAIGLEQYDGNREIVKDDVAYEKASLKNFNNYVNSEKSKSMVNFYSKGYLYLTHKRSSIKYISIEKL